ncbi:Phospholipase ABHD3 [Taenia solium]|eukprot:TsM_000499100 transcript=TsM_000499100 gene=TsM_000499100
MPSLSDYFVADACNASLLISSLLGAYITYYFLAVRSPPVVHGHSRKLVDFFRSHVPFLNEVYSPFVFGFTGRVQTILRPIFHRVEKCNYEEEVISFLDGGEMTLSWSKIEGMVDDTPTVVIFPGLNSCACSAYIVSLVKAINRCKYSCVVLNYRGTCRRKLKTPRSYCASIDSDVNFVLDHIRSRYPGAPMVAVGISLGAVIVFNYLADGLQDREKPCPLTAAMCICMPWDMLRSSDKLEKSLDWFLFNKPLTHGLCRVVNRNADVLSKDYDVPRILKSRSIREFDTNLTASMFGYKSAEDYYTRTSPAIKIDHVSIPVLCLTAADDPFVPFHTLPLKDVSGAGSRVVLAVTRHGGHIGFLSGLLPTGPSLLDRAVPQFISAIFQHPEDFAAAAATDAVEDASVSSKGGESESTKQTAVTVN